MPRLTKAVPKYRQHKPSGKAVVTLAGRDHYLGRYGTKASKAKYHRLIAEWEAAGRPSVEIDKDAPTVNELILAYWRHAESHYVKNGRPTDEQACIRAALGHVRALYGRSEAKDFGPLALKSVRIRMIESGNSRGYINKQVSRIRRMFSWAVENELLPGHVAHALREVKGLREGRTEARETDPVEPVADDVVYATLPFLPKATAAMVQVQRLCGCRPEDVCRMRPNEIDRSSDVWIYRPPVHKMNHKGKPRTIFIGPRCQRILMPFLFTSEDPCFRSKRGREYNTRSYRDAIHRACLLADVEKWNPNQLRHSAGTDVRRQYGLEGCQVILGHARADTTQIYAEVDLQKGIRIAREVG